MNKFIASLHLPTYKKLKYYNFYDVMEELTKRVYVEDFKKKDRNELQL